MVVCCIYTVMLVTYSAITYEYCSYVCSGVYACNLYRYHIDEVVFCRCLSLATVTNVGPQNKWWFAGGTFPKSQEWHDCRTFDSLFLGDIADIAVGAFIDFHWAFRIGTGGTSWRCRDIVAWVKLRGAAMIQGIQAFERWSCTCPMLLFWRPAQM